MTSNYRPKIGDKLWSRRKGNHTWIGPRVLMQGVDGYELQTYEFTTIDPTAGLTARPATLKQANELVKQLHRHHKPVTGHRFSIAAFCGDTLVGCAIVGRPVARLVDQYNVCEVVRLVTDGTKNACSFLYARCARAAEAMGFDFIQTYTLPEEGGASLRAAG